MQKLLIKNYVKENIYIITFFLSCKIVKILKFIKSDLFIDTKKTRLQIFNENSMNNFTT